MQGHFGVLNNLAVPLILGTSCNDRFVKVIFSKESGIVHIWSRLVLITLEYMPLLDQLPVLQTDSNAEVNTEDGQDKSGGKTLL